MLAVMGILAISAPLVTAKEGAVAILETVIHRDAKPGSIIDVRWAVFTHENNVQRPVTGAPIFVRLVGPDGSASEAFGVESPVGSGRYAASIAVPSGGIQDVIAGMRGDTCSEDGVCQRADYIFPPFDEADIVGDPTVLAPRAVSGSADGPTPPVGVGLAPIIALGIAFALAGSFGAAMAARRRARARAEAVGR
jgi:hypothetical protein